MALLKVSCQLKAKADTGGRRFLNFLAALVIAHPFDTRQRSIQPRGFRGVCGLLHGVLVLALELLPQAARPCQGVARDVLKALPVPDAVGDPSGGVEQLSRLDLTVPGVGVGPASASATSCGTNGGKLVRCGDDCAVEVQAPVPIDVQRQGIGRDVAQAVLHVVAPALEEWAGALGLDLHNRGRVEVDRDGDGAHSVELLKYFWEALKTSLATLVDALRLRSRFPITLLAQGVRGGFDATERPLGRTDRIGAASTPWSALFRLILKMISGIHFSHIKDDFAPAAHQQGFIFCSASQRLASRV